MAVEVASGAMRSAANLAGFCSLAAWLCVYSPQILEIYTLKDGDGVSVAFIAIWLAGDLTNAYGALRSHLLPTMILLGIYYTLCDIVILGQIFYYRWRARRRAAASSAESAPLLSDASAAAPNKPASRRARLRAALMMYLLVIAVQLVVGVGGWAVSEGRIPIPGRGPPRRDPGGDGGLGEEWDTGAQVLGWISAMLYLGSRIPQLLLNVKTGCKGLSLLFFLLGVWGNTSYVLSILLASPSPSHLFINLSWLVGSGGTILLDVIVIWQFWFFRKRREAMEKEEGNPEESAVASVL